MSKGIIETIIGGVEIAVGIVLVATGVGAALGAMLIAAGVGMTLSGIGTLLQGNVGGVITASRNPIKPWDVVYGRARIGGTIIYLAEHGDTNKYLDLVIVLAAHACKSVDQLLLDGQRLFFDDTNTSFQPAVQNLIITSIERANNVVTVRVLGDVPNLADGDDIFIQNVELDQTLNGRFPVTIITHSPNLIFTYLSGGQPFTGATGNIQTAWADYGREVYMEAMLGDQTLGQTFSGMINGTPYKGDTGNLIQNNNNGGGNPWTADCSCLGKTVVMLRLQYDTNNFASGIPQISFMVSGKNDIYDPRTDSYGYTENAALCIADYIAHPKWGFKAQYGTPAAPTLGEIPLTPLIAAANICDENVPLANGGIEPRYTCNGTFALNIRRGEILQNMLTSCGGRLTYLQGQFVIYPAAFAGVSATVTSSWLLSNSASGWRWRPTVSMRDLYNGVKGQFISPVNKWVPADFPGYAQDAMHGFNDGPPEFNYDANVAADGGERRWLDVQLPFTISPSTAQRLAKIELLRRRSQGTGTFALNMAGYQFVPMDVIQASLDFFGWDGKYLEILATRFKLDNQQSGDGTVILLGTEIDVQETDPSVYESNLADILNPQGYVQSNVPDNRTPAPPTNFKATPYQGIIILSWTTPVDAYVTNGGHLELRYQEVVSPPGIYVSLGSADPTTTQLNVTGLVPLATYLFEIRSVNAAGVPSAWVDATAVFPEPSAAVWMPNLISAPIGDPIPILPGDLTYNLNQLGSTLSPSAAVTGQLPVNAPIYVTAPTIGTVTVNGTGGNLLAGRTYYYRLAVINGQNPSEASIVDHVVLPGGADTQQIVLSSITFPPGTWTGWVLYVSIDREEMLCMQQTGTDTTAPTSITINDLPNRATYGPADTNIDHLRLKIKYLAQVGVVNGFVSSVGAQVGTGPLGHGWIKCMHLAADTTQDTNPYEGGVDWTIAKNATFLASDDWTGRILSVLTHKPDGTAPILDFRVVAYDSTNGQFYCDPDPAAIGVGPGDVFAVRFIPQWSPDGVTFTDPGMINGQYGFGTPGSGPAANTYGRIIHGPGQGQLLKVASHDQTSFGFVEGFQHVDDTSIIIIEFGPWLTTADGASFSTSAYGGVGAINLLITGLLERGLLTQVVTINKDGSEAPDELSPVREFFGFNDVSYGAGGALQEIAKIDFGRGSDGGPASVSVGDVGSLVEVDETVTLQGWSILNEGNPVGNSTFDLLRKPAGSTPDTAYASILGSNLITIPSGIHDTVIFSTAFGAGVNETLTKGDILKCVCISTGGTAPLSPTVRVFAGIPLPTTIDGSQTA